ncbi:response regulator [Granulicella paludicola]|uniref:response regulator n=1 Tax=Granulicella paludicola TaxID=474951 RepID=UPI0021E0C1D7|nr:response regulator [Granulicella paludicola]
MSEQNAVETPSYNAADDFDGDFNNADFDSSDGEGQPAPGTGQSKSSRRRRRKRKNKLAGDAPEGAPNSSAAPAPAPFVMEGESIAAAAAPAAAPQAPREPRRQSNNNGGAPQQNSNQNGQGQGQNGKRWKKKFRDRERTPRSGGGRSENPGNDFRADSNNNSGSGSSFSNGYRSSVPDNFGNSTNGFKRKGKGGQQKERGFVGPMDHSYREAGSGFGDGPPSTIQLGRRGGGHRHHGDSQPIDHSMPRPVPIPEGAQTHIYFFIEELFFQAKIQESAKKLGVKVAFIKNEKEAIASLTDGDQDKPALIVFDLNNANAKPLTLIPKLKTKLKRSASIIGFLSHLQGDLKAKAVEAGCDVVMPRAAFSQNLPNLLRRYGVEEAEEVNYNY